MGRLSTRTRLTTRTRLKRNLWDAPALARVQKVVAKREKTFTLTPTIKKAMKAWHDNAVYVDASLNYRDKTTKRIVPWNREIKRAFKNYTAFSEAVEQRYGPIVPKTWPPEYMLPKPTAKEPWQMTRDEFEQSAQRINAYLKQKKPESAKAIDRLTQISTYTHRKAVEQALASGKPVPTEVLKDYPELQAKPAPSTYSVVPEGSLYQAKKWREDTYKIVKKLRQQVKDAGPRAGSLRLDLLNAESQWKESIRYENSVKEALGRR